MKKLMRDEIVARIASVRTIDEARRDSVSSDRSGPSAESLARQAFEEIAGRPFTDEEWREADDSLADFFAIAMKWRENPLP